MIITIPYFPGYANYSRLAAAIQKQGRQDGHCVMVVSRRVDEEAAMEFEDSVKDVFSNHVHRVVDDPVKSGRYAMSNEMFRRSLWYLDQHEPKKAEAPVDLMLYFEAAVVPVNPKWLDLIQSEYFAKGGPQVLSTFQESGSPKGSVLFSRKYVASSALLEHLSPNVHWREYLRHEIGQNSKVSSSMSLGSKGVFRYPRSPSQTRKATKV